MWSKLHPGQGKGILIFPFPLLFAELLLLLVFVLVLVEAGLVVEGVGLGTFRSTDNVPVLINRFRSFNLPR